MPPIVDVILAVGIGVGGVAALVGLFILAAWLADRRADRDFPEVARDLAPDQPIQPWDTF
jgi:hypothetical protein